MEVGIMIKIDAIINEDKMEDVKGCPAGAAGAWNDDLSGDGAAVRRWDIRRRSGAMMWYPTFFRR